MADTSQPYELVEGVDYYFDGGRVIFTAKYLYQRGRCCENLCRHCPFRKPATKAAAATGPVQEAIPDVRTTNPLSR